MTAPTLTVVIPLHNNAAQVRETLESVLRQSDPADAVIVVDDGSSDASRAVVEAIDHPALRLIVHERALGPSAARNAGVRAATTDWVAFQDADDLWSPDHLATVKAMIAGADEAVVGAATGWRKFWPDGRVQPDRLSGVLAGAGPVRLSFEALLFHWVRLDECPLWTGAVAFRRSVLAEAGLFNTAFNRGEDKDLWLRCAALGDVLRHDAVTAYYRQAQQGQLTGSASTNIRHCLCDTIVAMAPRRRLAEQSLLRRLFNQETFNYATLLKQAHRVDPSTYRGFYVRENPVRYLALLAMTALPAPIQLAMRRISLAVLRPGQK